MICTLGFMNLDHAPILTLKWYNISLQQYKRVLLVSTATQLLDFTLTWGLALQKLVNLDYKYIYDSNHRLCEPCAWTIRLTLEWNNTSLNHTHMLLWPEQPHNYSILLKYQDWFGRKGWNWTRNPSMIPIPGFMNLAWEIILTLES